MADKRCFASAVIESDAFYSLSKPAQALYIHLCMNADNRGFIGNVKNIMRTGGFSASSKTELLQNRFVLDCGGGVVVIKAWNTHNNLRKDRYLRETMYTEALSNLFIKSNGSYTENDESGAVPAMSALCPAYDRHMTGEYNISEENRKEDNSNGIEGNPGIPSTPSIQDVEDFAEAEGLTIDAQAFIDYNQSRGWKAGKTMIADWRIYARKWAKNGEAAQKQTEADRDPGDDADTDAFGNPIKPRWQ